MPENLSLEFLSKIYPFIMAGIAGVVYVVTRRNNTDRNTSSIEKEAADRKAADSALWDEVRRLENRIIARQDADKRDMNIRFDDLKHSLEKANDNLTELLKRGSK